MSIVNYKVYLIREDRQNNKPEIRRFEMHSSFVYNLQYLQEKLQLIFPSIRGKRYTITWKDKDNDDIVVSSSEELSIAMTNNPHKNHVYRFYVTLHTDKGDDKN